MLLYSFLLNSYGSNYTHHPQLLHFSSANEVNIILAYSLYSKQQHSNKLRYKVPKLLSSYRYQQELLNNDPHHDVDVHNSVSSTSKLSEVWMKCKG